MSDLDEDELKATRRLNGVDILDEGKEAGVNMSEEEIINKINYMINNWHRSVVEINIKWIQGLLDLYNHEKATSHYLQSELDKKIDNLVEEQNEREKYTHELEHNSTTAYSKGYADGSWNEGENWKNKIREKIKEVQGYENVSICDLVEFAEAFCVETLQALLEEENNENN